jgi:hypothetical protein
VARRILSDVPEHAAAVAILEHLGLLARAHGRSGGPEPLRHGEGRACVRWNEAGSLTEEEEGRTRGKLLRRRGEAPSRQKKEQHDQTAQIKQLETEIKG